tara:strand:+ start:775 stop:2022 length:1248 start_codon:yes stop_codon:yes gene_type:complete
MRRLVKISLVLTIFIMLAGVAYGIVTANYVSDDTPSISVSISKQDPNPVKAGEVVEVNFKIDNSGFVARDFLFEVVPEYPFTLVSGKAQTEVGTLHGAQSDRFSEVVKYRLRVSNNAPDGRHKIKVKYKLGSNKAWTIVEDLYLEVQSSNAIVSVDKSTTSPEVIAPGETGKLKIDLKNYATSMMRDVTVVLDLSSIPLSPIGSSNEKVISVIDGGDKKAVVFDLLADYDAESRAYKIPTSLGYADVLNNNFTKDHLLTVVVGDEPEMVVTLDSTDIYTAGSGTVSLRITNKGLSDIKLLNVKMKGTEEIQILSSEDLYVGNIDSDDYETADFDIFVNSKVKGDLKIPLLVEYKDSTNKDFSENIDLRMPIYSKSEAKKLGLVAGNGKAGLFFLLIIVIVVGVIIYRRRKKKKKK